MAAIREISEVKKELEAKKRELRDALADRDALSIMQPLSDEDEIGIVVERAVVTAELERKSHVLREVTLALQRLQSGDYGFCVECGAEISLDRLRCVPWTPYCLQCQEANERSSPAPEQVLDLESELGFDTFACGNEVIPTCSTSVRRKANREPPW